MNRLAIIVAFGSLLNTTLPCQGQTTCEVAVLGSVEAHKPDLSLADLLVPGTCPPILASASEVGLGRSPLPGSARIFEGGQVRALLEQIVWKLPAEMRTNLIVSVPERVSVRRSSLLSCSEIASRLSPDLNEIDCAAAERVSREAQLEIARKTWNRATRTWDVVVRCTRPGDCVPFLVRVPQGAGVASPPELGYRHPSGARDAHSLFSAQDQVLVRSGQLVTLVWDQKGIRVVVSAVCLDQGRQGEIVRARIAHTGRIVSAVVVGRARLLEQS